jgi:mono/diheme cytochrome c family protein
MNSEAKTATTATEENVRPAVGVANLPMWLIVATLGLLYWSALSFDRTGGWFDARVYSPYTRPPDEWQPPIGPADPAVLGRAVYNKPTCVACHQANGQGMPGQFPTLHGTDWVLEKEPGRLIRIVLDGLQGGPININGQPFTYGATMTPWRDILSDDEIAAVLTYIRQNKDWGNNAPVVTPDRVKAIREQTKDRSNRAYTPDEVMKLSPAE